MNKINSKFALSICIATLLINVLVFPKLFKNSMNCYVTFTTHFNLNSVTDGQKISKQNREYFREIKELNILKENLTWNVDGTTNENKIYRIIGSETDECDKIFNEKIRTITNDQPWLNLTKKLDVKSQFRYYFFFLLNNLLLFILFCGVYLLISQKLSFTFKIGSK